MRFDLVVVPSGALRTVGTNLCRGGEAGVGLGGADLQQVQVVAALVVQRPGQAERAALPVDAEQIPRIDQQHVGQAFLLEGDSRNRGNAARTHTDLDLCPCSFNTRPATFYDQRKKFQEPKQLEFPIKGC